ncbi:hypothetical protein [Isoalcanivorax indicus]|uniref:hypothetical protein n=1 Tax=Isoalcanivorax indicus TaxID=2202653 RepID=UPI000DBA7732|nr:hypothetical protein [Isoalcanivorax indicus]
MTPSEQAHGKAEQNAGAPWPEEEASAGGGDPFAALDDLRHIGGDASALARDTLVLLKAELRLFLTTLLTIIMLAAMTGLLLAGTLMVIGGSTAWALVDAGRLTPLMAGLAMVCFLLVATGLAWLWIRRLTADMRFAGSREAVRALAALRMTLPRENSDVDEAAQGASSGAGATPEGDGSPDDPARPPG